MKREGHSLLNVVKSKKAQILLGFSCAALIFLANRVPIPLLSWFINKLDNRIYDQMVQLNWRSHQTNPRVVIVNIDNKSIKNEGRWPWPRNKMADLINKLKQNGVVTLALDIVMSEAEINYAIGLKDELLPLMSQLTSEEKLLPVLLNKIAPKVNNDQIFANALLGHDVVLGFLFHNEKTMRKGVLPSPITNPEGKPLYRDKLSLYQFSGYNGCLPMFLKASTQAGVVTNLPDSDGAIRHGLMLTSYENKLYPSLALATAMNYLLVKHITLKTYNHMLYGIQMGGVFIPTNPQGQILIPFWGRPGTLDYYSATDIMQDKVSSDQLAGAIAVIGSTTVLLGDLHLSPVAQLFPGVEMIGNMIQGIIGQQLLSQYNWQTVQGQLYLGLIGLFFALLFSYLSIIILLLTTIISIVGIQALSLYLFVSKNLYLPSASMLLFIILLMITNYVYQFIIERRQKRKINQLFGQYVPEAYVKELIESPGNSSMEGQERYMTVLFSDIRNFTTMSENLEAFNVKKLLNTFFTSITEIIFHFRGTIDKYVGDMIVAFWGAPIHDKDHAYHAIMCSLAMVKQLPKINTGIMEKNLPPVDIGIGLATGWMDVGDMGSEFRRAYTVIGDTVNLASRLQDLTKFYQITILVSDGARKGQDQFVWRIVDKIAVKGRKRGLTVYQPLDVVDEISEEIISEVDEYHKALEDYYAMNWLSAKEKFTSLKNKFPGVYLYQMYFKRIEAFQAVPPAEDWNGTYVHLHK